MSWKNVLREVAPTLARVVGGPAGPLLDAGVRMLSTALLGKPDGALPEIERAVLAMPPELAAQLAMADKEFRLEQLKQGVRFDELDLERDRLVVEDRSSARERDVQLATAGLRNRRGDVLAYGAIGLLALFVVLVFLKQIPDAGPTRDILFTLAGGIIALVKDVFGFEFGSSRGSEQKTAMLKDRAP